VREDRHGNNKVLLRKKVEGRKKDIEERGKEGSKKKILRRSGKKVRTISKEKGIK